MSKRRNKKEILGILLIIVFMVSILSTIGLICCTKNLKNNSQKCHIEKRTTEEKKTVTQLRKKENIVFLGDSITDYYPIEDIYMDLPIVKSGVAGYRTQDILDRMDSMVYQYNPTKVFLLIGTNDLTENIEQKRDYTTKKIEEIIEKIKEKRKKTKIYLESIYPVNEKIDKKTVDGRKNNIINDINENLKEYCKNNRVVYIDMYKELADEDNNFSKKYTDDGLHPNDLGYAKISQVRIKYIYDIE